MKLKNTVNEIAAKTYEGIDLIEIGNAMNISGIRSNKLQELNNYFNDNFEVIKALLNN